MSIFLITFLTIYGSIHCYAYYKLRNTFKFGLSQILILKFVMALMTISPLFVRVAEYFSTEKTAQIIAWPGFIWMGFIFIFVSIQLITDLLLKCYSLFSHYLYKHLPKCLPNVCINRIALILAITASIYALYEAGQIKSEHVIIKSNKLPSSVTKIRIVQISDLHIGLLLQETRLKRIIEIIVNARPDIIVSTGDLVDGKLNRDDKLSGLNPMAALIASIQAPSGKYAVVGNHEVYASLPQALAFTRAAGFTTLRNQTVTLPDGITITGIDDRAVNRESNKNKNSETPLLDSASKNSFHLLLKHRPDLLQQSDGLFDLQLSGHTHNGQIFPFNFLVRLKHRIPCGTTSTPKSSLIHVSRGTGTWGPPMRLFAPPEVTVIDILRTDK